MALEKNIGRLVYGEQAISCSFSKNPNVYLAVRDRWDRLLNSEAAARPVLFSPTKEGNVKLE